MEMESSTNKCARNNNTIRQASGKNQSFRETEDSSHRRSIETTTRPYRRTEKRKNSKKEEGPVQESWRGSGDHGDQGRSSCSRDREEDDRSWQLPLLR
uniref:HDC11191 n=1 Tax=Drosophila melanogaster TaxID=7227 RepID=Q6IKX6_DROME|nr:TPA_inf: HDC11191 [Drosophila melanogaster]